MAAAEGRFIILLRTNRGDYDIWDGVAYTTLGLAKKATSNTSIDSDEVLIVTNIVSVGSAPPPKALAMRWEDK